MTPVMNPGPTSRGTSVFCALAAGFLLGAATVAGGCAPAERKAPPLPAARVDWAQAVAGPRQVLVCGETLKAEERVNNLLLQGWRAVPGTQAVLAQPHGGSWPIYSIILEQKPRK